MLVLEQFCIIDFTIIFDDQFLVYTYKFQREGRMTSLFMNAKYYRDVAASTSGEILSDCLLSLILANFSSMSSNCRERCRRSVRNNNVSCCAEEEDESGAEKLGTGFAFAKDGTGCAFGTPPAIGGALGNIPSLKSPLLTSRISFFISKYSCNAIPPNQHVGNKIKAAK